MDKIKLRDLQRVVNLIFEHIIEDLGVNEVEIPIDKDFYWDFATRQKYDVKEDQPKASIGRLTDDWEFLAEIRKKDMAPALMLMHVGPLLVAVGELIGR